MTRSSPHTAGGVRLARALAHAEGLGGPLDAEVLVVAQHYRDPLAGRAHVVAGAVAPARQALSVANAPADHARTVAQIPFAHGSTT
jgi:hypothetical protein